MARVAVDTLILGTHGQIDVGEDVPATWSDLWGVEHDTDFARLEELGAVEPEGEQPAPRGRRGRRAAAEAEVAPEPEPEADVSEPEGEQPDGEPAE